MEPVTLALTIAGLIAKAAEHFGDGLWDKFSEKAADTAGQEAGDAGFRVLGRIAARVRGWFADRDDTEGATALDTVAAAPDSTRAVERLAALLEQRLRQDQGFSADLAALVAEAQHAGGDVQQFSVTIMDNARVGKITQIGSVDTAGGDFHV
jgi:hypothetical protein